MRRLLGLLLLAALLSSSCGIGTRGGEAGEIGTVQGRVLLGPTCPVQTEASPCPDEPLAGVTVQAVEGDVVVATAESDAQGRFSMDLVPRTYLVQAVPEDDPARTAKPIEVTVVAGETVEVDVPVDSGIR